MNWRDYLKRIKDIQTLEETLTPPVVEHEKGIRSTAYTDVKTKTIHLDVSQHPIKTALSYAYELKNLENAAKYEQLNQQATQHSITKAQYVTNVIRIEAEAVYFRCKVFDQLGSSGDLPFKQEYWNIYKKKQDPQKTITELASYILENGIVRREYSAKKFYCDCYDTYAGKKLWPNFYDEQRKNSTIILSDPQDEPEDGDSPDETPTQSSP